MYQHSGNAGGETTSVLQSTSTTGNEGNIKKTVTFIMNAK